MKKFIQLLVISFFCISLFQSYEIESVENYQTLTFNIENYYKIFEFNTTNYFKNEISYINIIQRKYDPNINNDLTLYIYYYKSKIELDFFDAKNYDQRFYMVNYRDKILQLSLNLTDPFIYLVFTYEKKQSNTFSFQIFNSNSFSKISNNYFKFDKYQLPNKLSYDFTFSFTINTEDDYIYYENNIKENSGTINMIVMDIDKNTLYETDELSKYISLTKYIKNGTKLFFIKMRITSNTYDFQININKENTKYDIQKLDRKNYRINITTIKESQYYFYVNTTNIDNTLYFDFPRDSLNDTSLYYYFFKTYDIDQIKLELAKRKYDSMANIYLNRYSASISNDTKCMIIKIFPKNNCTNFYFKVIYHNWFNINSFEEKDLKISNKQYIILKYNSSNYFNEDKNSFISVMIDNGTEDFYVGLFSEINDIYPENLKNNRGNLISRNYINFNYVKGDKYFFVSNFKNNLNDSKIKVINNKEYYDMTYKIFNSDGNYHNFTSTFKFKRSSSQNLTLSFTPFEANACLHFMINSPNLTLQINAFTDDGEIKPVEENCFKTNDKKMFFELMVSSEKKFEEFQFLVQYQKEKEKENEIPESENSFNVLAIIIPIIAIILLIIATIILIIFKKKKTNKNAGYSSSDLNSNDINQQNMYGQNIELNQMQNYEKPYYS